MRNWIQRCPNFLNYNPGDGMRVLGLILAGGKSSRMGQDKLAMEVAGFSLLALATQSLRDCAMIAIAAGENILPDDVSMYPLIADSESHVGPRAGLFPGLLFAAENGFELVQFSPCDTPLVNSDVFMELKRGLADADCCVPRTEAGIHPLHALVRTGAFLKALRENGKNFNIHSLVTSLSHNEILVDGDMMLNINSPEDMNDLKEQYLTDLQQRNL